jgi:MFS family permease
MALFGILPLLFGGIGNPVSVFVASKLLPRLGSIRQTRRVMAYLGFTGASGFLILSTHVNDAFMAVVAIAMASFCNDLVMPGSWASAMDIGGKHAGSLSGAMNMCGNLGGALCPVVIGYILHWTNQNWNLTFYVSAAVYLMGIVCWRFLDPVTPLEVEEPAFAH